jgi:hypothetical protein
MEVGAMSAPTTFTGYVDDASWYSQVLVDATEQVADLHWPTSVTTFSQMRRDPQLAAVLKALTLPIRQATTQVNPLGARPEAVQLVADGLGLPVADSTTPRTSARVRGVRWADHQRLSLLDLVFGHMPFEEQYEVTDLTRLTRLSERMPVTIRSLEINRDGDLKAIRQWATPGQSLPPEIPAAHLLFYAHEREGSAWQGQSILRPAYAAWMLKREMLRAHAIGNRRFNHGVPTVEWAAGSDPTPAQIADAAAFASAARAGDQAGASLPPGAHLVLAGLSGGVPDTLGFVRYLDQQMSRMVLAGMLDLGETPNGSRALGAEFVDLFLLSIQALADDHASTITSQTAARIVAYNFGDDEPVPAVETTDVGSKREVTVEALQGLISSGALEADAELDAWLRREWKLPARTTPWVPPTKPGAAPAQDPFGPGASQVDAAAGMLAYPNPYAPSPLRRQPTEVERHVDFEALHADHQAALAHLLAAWPHAVAPQRQQVLASVAASAEKGDLSGLPGISVDSATAAELLEAALVAVASRAADQMRAEAAAQGVHVPSALAAAAGDRVASITKATLRRLAKVAKATAAVMAGGLAYTAAKEALRVWASGRSGDQVAADVETHLDGLSVRYVEDQLGAALTAAQNEGRFAVIAAAEQEPRLFASEVLDRNTCGPCQRIDGHQYESLAAARAAYASGGFSGCSGRLRCRGIVAARW